MALSILIFGQKELKRYNPFQSQASVKPVCSSAPALNAGFCNMKKLIVMLLPWMDASIAHITHRYKLAMFMGVEEMAILCDRLMFVVKLTGEQLWQTCYTRMLHSSLHFFKHGKSNSEWHFIYNDSISSSLLNRQFCRGSWWSTSHPCRERPLVSSVTRTSHLSQASPSTPAKLYTTCYAGCI